MNLKMLKITALTLIAIFIISLSCPRVSARENQTIVRVLFLVTDEDGRWDKNTQEKLFPELPKPGKTKNKGGSQVKIFMIHPGDAFDEKTALAIPTTDRPKLLRFPGALLSSKNAGKIFSVDFILEVRTFPVNNRWGARGVLHSIKTGETGYMNQNIGKDKKDAVSKVLENLPSTLGLTLWELDLPVVGAKEGMLYHKKGSGHVTNKGTRVSFINPRLAREAGFRPCLICFPRAGFFKQNDPLEAALGRELARIIENTYVVSSPGDMTRRVERLGRNVVKKNRFDQYTYRFRVLDTDVVNAYSIPAGGVYMTRGLMEILESDDEVAGILSHEIAHCNRHHSVKMYRRARTHAYLGAALVIATGSGWMAAISDFANNFFVSGWSRGFETEADRFGIIYAQAAGYDPDEYVIALKKLHDYGKLHNEGHGWFRTHPTDEQRIKDAGITIKSLSHVEKAACRLEKTDPDVAEYVRTHPFNYLDDKKCLEEFTSIFNSLRFNAPPGGYILIPLDQLKKKDGGKKNDVEKGGVAPPEGLDKK